MRINNINGKYLNTNINKPKEEKQKGVDKILEKSVNVEISDSAKNLVRTMDRSIDSNFNHKVESIRQLILEGKYKVSTEDIAEKILQVIELQKGSEI